MAKKTLSNSEKSDQVCVLCRKTVGISERYTIQIINKESKEKLFFHITKEDGFSLSKDQLCEFGSISSKNVFDPLIVSPKVFNDFRGRLNSLYILTKEEEEARAYGSQKIFEKILFYDKKRRDEECQDERESGGSFAMAASMA
ncbi:hypothetical protein IPN41_03695 [Candidatus Falkowbacteria bacterium]|nr:MAG: hypothetical protein IPN41_03695 [Candidatus Falkowbacteria bacterium]